MARFQREAEVLASISHPNIGHIYGYEDSGTTQALVLELIPGQTLAEQIAAGPIAIADARAIAAQIATALRVVCGRGVLLWIQRSAAWSPRASWALAGSSVGKTLAIPFPPGQSLPALPAAGTDPARDGADIKGARLISQGAMSPGRDPATYVFARTDLLRNLYRIPLP